MSSVLANNISGKVVVITGGSSGLGETTARHLASLGAIEIPKTKYKILLFKAVEEVANFRASSYSPDVSAIAQRRAQTS